MHTDLETRRPLINCQRQWRKREKKKKLQHRRVRREDRRQETGRMNEKWEKDARKGI